MADNNSYIATNSALTPSDWVETTLGDVVEIQPGFAFKSQDFSSNKGFPVIKIKNIQPPIVKIQVDDLVDVGSYTEERLEKFKVKNGEYLIAMTGETIGKVGKYNLGSFAYINQRVCKIVETEKSYYKFIYYTLLKESFQKFINTHSFGAAQANISTDQIGKYKISLPPLPEQQAISSVLSAFDDKIELLREQNKTLEEIGQTIFKEWFGKYSPERPEELPEGWRVGKLGEVCEVISKGTTPTSSQVENFDKKIPFIKVKDISENGIINTSSLDLIPDEVHKNALKRSILKTDDILFSIAGTIGRVSILPENLNNTNCNQAIAFIRLKDRNYLEFIHQNLISQNIQNFILGSIVQGVQANVSLTVLGNIPIIFPDNYILLKFNDLVNPVYEKISDNNSQIQSLACSRDELLPRLMSGDLIVRC